MSLLFDHFLFCRRHSGLVDEVLALKRPEGASALAGRIRQFLIDSAASKGFSGQAMTRLISAFNDQLTGRIIEIAASNIVCRRSTGAGWRWVQKGDMSRPLFPIRITVWFLTRQTAVRRMPCVLFFCLSHRRLISALLTVVSNCAPGRSWRVTRPGACRWMSGAVNLLTGCDAPSRRLC